MAALDAFEPGRILDSVDHPFGSLAKVRPFLNMLPGELDVLAEIAQPNADRLLDLGR